MRVVFVAPARAGFSCGTLLCNLTPSRQTCPSRQTYPSLFRAEHAIQPCVKPSRENRFWNIGRKAAEDRHNCLAILLQSRSLAELNVVRDNHQRDAVCNVR